MDSAPKAMGAGPSSRLVSSQGDSDVAGGPSSGPSSSRAAAAAAAPPRARCSRLARPCASGLKELDWPSKNPALFSKLKPETGHPWDAEHHRAVRYDAVVVATTHCINFEFHDHALTRRRNACKRLSSETCGIDGTRECRSRQLSFVDSDAARRDFSYHLFCVSLCTCDGPFASGHHPAPTVHTHSRQDRPPAPPRYAEKPLELTFQLQCSFPGCMGGVRTQYVP